MKQVLIFLCSICFISRKKLLFLLLMAYLTKATNEHFRTETGMSTKKNSAEVFDI